MLKVEFICAFSFFYFHFCLKYNILTFLLFYFISSL